MTPRFIAEVSSNHNRDLDRSLAFIDAAADAGCDAVKFQLFKVEELFAPEILERSDDVMRRKEWELPVEFLPRLSEKCSEREIDFICTPFYLDAVEELKPYVAEYKIASYELMWDDLLVACARTGQPVILSTGMATMGEVIHAVDVLRDANASRIEVLHCVSKYPVAAEECNLAAIETLRQATGCPVGWSDHSVDPAVIERAAHRWHASTIEFHFDLDEQGEEYGAGHCWLPATIAATIESVRRGHSADGTGEKAPAKSEADEREWRADPNDGLRPLKHVRDGWRP